MLLSQANDLLRAKPWMESEGRWAERLIQLLTMEIIFGVFYGGVMGTFGGLTDERLMQVVYSGIKVPFLLIATFLLSLPSFFVINSLFGLRSDFAPAVRALLATQAGLTIVLASLAPFTMLWYVSYSNYNAAILFNTLMFGCASVAAQILLRRFYKPLIERSRRHLILLRIWLVIYAFVGIQMGWVLRPFIGSPHMPPQFFRQEAWGNAYVKLANIFWAYLNSL
jgi:hypothetical protein